MGYHDGAKERDGMETERFGTAMEPVRRAVFRPLVRKNTLRRSGLFQGDGVPRRNALQGADDS